MEVILLSFFAWDLARLVFTQQRARDYIVSTEDRLGTLYGWFIVIVMTIVDLQGPSP